MHPIAFLPSPGLRAVCCGLALLLGVPAVQAVDAGLRIGAQPQAQDLGLPIYPGAQPQRDAKDDDGAVSFNLWGGAFGLRLAVAKYRSNDPASAVLRYYRDALAPYGKVLECRGGSRPAADARPKARGEAGGEAGGARPLSCEDAGGAAGTVTLRVGVERNQRQVIVEPKGDGVHFQLVRIEVKGD